jgi:DNA-binding transcriptional ArsR family regulator
MCPVRAREQGPSLAASAALFAALGDEQRMAIVERLCRRGPLSIARLAEGSDITRQAVTKHLHVLARAGLVRGTRKGRERVWELEARRLSEARRYLDRISTQWDEAIDRLRHLVE